MTAASLVARLGAIPLIDAVLAEHVEDNDEVLPYLFLADVTRWLTAYAEVAEPTATERKAADSVIEVLDDEGAAGDDETRYLIVGGFLENLPYFDEGHPVWGLLTERLIAAPRGVSETRAAPPGWPAS
jgi:hypothetical protein